MDSYEGIPPSEDVLMGTPEGNHLSPVRRFFSLLVTFDFLFTILLWTLCIILVKGDSSIPEALENQILNYSLYHSIFDVVMLAACRFTILLLFYALLSIHHWLPVALTTAGSCAFLLAKVFLFDWNQFLNATYPVMLILSSFVIAWSEAWFFDFRVVPQERQAAIFYARHSRSYNGEGGNRSVIPWLSQTVSQIMRNSNQTQSYPESTSNFYSPMESPIHSDNEGENQDSETESMEKKSRRLQRNLESPEVNLWIQQGPIIANELVEKINVSDWILERTSQEGDSAFSQKLQRKIFMISGIIPHSPSRVAKELFDNMEDTPNWNPTVTHCEILQHLNATSDISYQVCKSNGISPRDFVVLRHYRKPIGEFKSHVLAGVSVKHTSKPNQPKFVRGTNEVSGWVLTPSYGNENETEFQLLIDVDLHISMVPRRLIDNGVISAALETLTCLRKKLSFLDDNLQV